MKTLFIVYTYLSGNGGGVYASRTHVNLFAALSEKMTLVYPYKEGETLELINKEGVDLVPVSDRRSNVWKFLDLLRGRVHRYNLDNSFFDKDKYDVVVFDSSVVSSGLVKKFHRTGIKTITIHHNYQIQYLMGDGSPLTLLPNLFWTWIYEGQAVRNSDLNITLTQQDVDLLKSHYDKKAIFDVLGVFEYQNTEPVKLDERARGHHYVITGGLGSKQTADSIIRWIKDYYPILLKTDPIAKVTIAGSSPSVGLIHTIETAGIDLINSPESMDPILRDADYYICPVDCGGGLKLRNLDGLKYGLPVLTHKVSLRGYEKMEEMGVILSYESPEEFETGLRKMLEIKLNKTEIQGFYLQQYMFTQGVNKLRGILQKKRFA